MSTKKQLTLNIVSSVMSLSTILLSQNQFDSTQKIQQASVHESQMSKDDLGTFGACGSSYDCSGGGGKCGSSYDCSGGGGKCGSSYNCSGQ